MNQTVTTPPAVPFGASKPGDDLHHAVIMAVGALAALVEAAPLVENPETLFYAVEFITNGLQAAANKFERAGFRATGEAPA